MEYEQGELKFTIRPFPPFMSMKLLGELQKLVLPALSEAVGQDVGEDLSIRKTAKLMDTKINLGAAGVTLSKNLQGDNLVKYMKDIIKADYIIVQQPGKDACKLDEAKVAELFTGHLMSLFQLAFKVIETNYSDFFEQFQILSGKVK